MIKHYYKTKKDGSTCVLTCSTRKANYQDIYFGIFSHWPTKEAYKKGDTRNVVTYKNVFLGYSGLKSDLVLNANHEAYLILKKKEVK